MKKTWKANTTAWVLRHSKGYLLFAPGCYVAPHTFPTRVVARDFATQMRREDPKMRFRPVHVQLTVTAREI